VRIPFVDLGAQTAEVRPAIDEAFRSILDRSAFHGGPAVPEFEEAFATFCGARHAVALASGTDALELGLRAIGVGPGDVVVTVPNTFIGTVEGVVQLGAEPRFVDVDQATYNMSPERLADYLYGRCERDAHGVLRERGTGLRVAAVLPVHLYGLPCDMRPLLAIARELGVDVVEDACQAHGASYKIESGEFARAGTLGRLGCFSFYPAKNLGAFGEAGALVTDDDVVAARVRVLRDHGQRERYLHVSADGVNARIDSMQAVVLTIKLRQLASWNESRRRAAEWYREELGRSGLPLPVEPEGANHVYHLYVTRVPERDRVRQALEERGIATGVHYPVPLHLQPAFEYLRLGPGSFPVTERLASEVVSLPMYPHITREQVAYVAEQVTDVVPRLAVGVG
jgi:dTDP-4-amino-4,6-dideoxygalactose transaminase